MKKLILPLLSMSILLTTSCSSDKLTNSKAKKIAEKCVESKGLNKQTTSFKIGAGISLGEDSLKYRKLEKEGYLNIKELPKKYEYQTYTVYDVTLTEKAKPYIEEIKDDIWNDVIKNITVKTNDLELDEVYEIQEIPSFNEASVKLKFKKTNKTPFYPFLIQNSRFDFIAEETDDILVKKASFFKTSDKGWKWCDK